MDLKQPVNTYANFGPPCDRSKTWKNRGLNENDLGPSCSFGYHKS